MVSYALPGLYMIQCRTLCKRIGMKRLSGIWNRYEILICSLLCVCYREDSTFYNGLYYLVEYVLMARTVAHVDSSRWHCLIDRACLWEYQERISHATATVLADWQNTRTHRPRAAPCSWAAAARWARYFVTSDPSPGCESVNWRDLKQRRRRCASYIAKPESAEASTACIASTAVS